MTDDEKPKEDGRIARTAVGLRDALFDQLERLRDGKSKSADAAAFASVSGAIIKSAEVQIKYHKLQMDGELQPGILPELEGPGYDAAKTTPGITRHRLK